MLYFVPAAKSYQVKSINISASLDKEFDALGVTNFTCFQQGCQPIILKLVNTQ